MSPYIIEVLLGICLILTIVLLYSIVLAPTIVSIWRWLMAGLGLGNKNKRGKDVK